MNISKTVAGHNKQFNINDAGIVFDDVGHNFGDQIDHFLLNKQL